MKNLVRTVSETQKIASLILLLFVFVSLSEAADAGNGSTDIQVLHGKTYELGERERTIVTFEHASAWSKGDNYFFFDVTSPGQDSTAIYGEFSPSVSASKIFGQDLSTWIVKDYRATATVEMGNRYGATLYGVGVDLAMPFFSMLKVNLYLRDTTNADSTTSQVTITWRAPLEMVQNHFIFSGFADFAGTERARVNNQLVVPQLLWDLGEKWQNPEGLYLGIEYQNWKNKAGVEGSNESVVQVMLKWYLN